MSSQHSWSKNADRKDDEDGVSEAEIAGGSSERWAVLVVDDNRINQRVAIRMLRKLGCEVAAAADGLQAVQLFAQSSYDLILMDCHMPVMDGFEATVELRKYDAERGARTPIVGVTASTTPEDHKRCFGVGMDQVVLKPLQISVLQGLISTYILPKPTG